MYFLWIAHSYKPTKEYNMEIEKNSNECECGHMKTFEEQECYECQLNKVRTPDWTFTDMQYHQMKGGLLRIWKMGYLAGKDEAKERK